MKKIQVVPLIISLIFLAATWGTRDGLAQEETTFPSVDPFEVYLMINRTDISDRALSGAKGVIGINMAAGNDNLQVNARTIAIGDGAPVFSNIGIYQRQNNNTNNTMSNPELVSYHIDHIGGEAFSNSRGLISINQTAGSGNTQANLVSIGTGTGGLGFGVAVSNDQLLMSHGQQSETGFQGNDRRRADIIDGNAFSGAVGLVQVNQSAGSANRILSTTAIRFNVMTNP